MTDFSIADLLFILSQETRQGVLEWHDKGDALSYSFRRNEFSVLLFRNQQLHNGRIILELVHYNVRKKPTPGNPVEYHPAKANKKATFEQPTPEEDAKLSVSFEELWDDVSRSEKKSLPEAGRTGHQRLLNLFMSKGLFRE